MKNKQLVTYALINALSEMAYNQIPEAHEGQLLSFSDLSLIKINDDVYQFQCNLILHKNEEK